MRKGWRTTKERGAVQLLALPLRFAIRSSPLPVLFLRAPFIVHSIALELFSRATHFIHCKQIQNNFRVQNAINGMNEVERKKRLQAQKRGVGEIQPSTGTVATPSAGFVKHAYEHAMNCKTGSNKKRTSKCEHPRQKAREDKKARRREKMASDQSLKNVCSPHRHC